MREESLCLAVLVLSSVFAVACRPAADPGRALQSLLDRAVEMGATHWKSCMNVM